MHSLALLSLLVPNGLLMPPVTKHKGPHVLWENAYTAQIHFADIGEANNIHATGGSERYWRDGGKFPSKENLEYSGVGFWDSKDTVRDTKKGSEICWMFVIDCKTEANAKKLFLLCRLYRLPNYARSGEFLIHSDPRAFEYFTKHFGGESYLMTKHIGVK